MPRKAPNLNGGVIEHRITLGDYERKALTKQLNEDDLIKKVNTGVKIGQTVLIGAGGIALGTLAVTAYREANDLVDTITDIPSSGWAYLKFRLGLISMQELMNTVGETLEENEEASQERKNQGILEWGAEWLLKFLLGDDMIFTKATEGGNGGDTTPTPTPDPIPYDGATEEGLTDPLDPYYSTTAGWYWDDNTQAWRMGEPPEPRPAPPSQGSWDSEYYDNLERIFCDITSPDYDEEACRDVQMDRLRLGL